MSRYNTCPGCGGKKRSIARMCKRCYSLPQNMKSDHEIDYSLATPEWWREFAGLFWGEGSAMIARNNRSFSPILCIRLRDDDAEVIYEIQRVLGGRILHSYRHKRNPEHGNQIEWRTTNIKHVAEIAENLLRHSSLSAKKKSDVAQVLDFCKWRLSIGRYYTDEQRTEAERRMTALRESRKYKP